MLKYFFLILFIAGMVFGYLMLSVPPDTSYDETLTRVWHSFSVIFICAAGGLYCVHRISR